MQCLLRIRHEELLCEKLMLLILLMLMLQTGDGSLILLVVLNVLFSHHLNRAKTEDLEDAQLSPPFQNNFQTISQLTRKAPYS